MLVSQVWVRLRKWAMRIAVGIVINLNPKDTYSGSAKINATQAN